jgi:hypothetical protein
LVVCAAGMSHPYKSNCPGLYTQTLWVGARPKTLDSVYVSRCGNFASTTVCPFSEKALMGKATYCDQRAGSIVCCGIACLMDRCS